MTSLPLGERLIRKERPYELMITAFQQYSDAKAPITFGLIGFVGGIFIGEIFLATLIGTSSVEVFATGLFKLYPMIAWPLAPFLHQGVVHFTSNVVGLILFGLPVEDELSSRQYAVFSVVVAALSTALGAVLMASGTTKPIAFYGISGVVYALAGFAFVHFATHESRMEVIEWIAFVGGAAAVLHVGFDVLTGLLISGNTINGGHLTGLIVGISVSRLRK
jgi:membrane associated rhomboid family serine protease